MKNTNIESLNKQTELFQEVFNIIQEQLRGGDSTKLQASQKSGDNNTRNQINDLTSYIDASNI
jgi:hypothetical protein